MKKQSNEQEFVKSVSLTCGKLSLLTRKSITVSTQVVFAVASANLKHNLADWRWHILVSGFVINNVSFVIRDVSLLNV